MTATTTTRSGAGTDTDCEVLVVGAGLAGLQCARTLHRAGVDVQVWEAAEEVGGRIRTDRVDGFLLDRGFQVLNPAYPAVQQHIDVAALDLHAFGAGAMVRREDRLAVLADPRREPALIGDVLRSGYLVPGDLLALARWAGPSLGPTRRLTRGGDGSTRAALDHAGLQGPLREVVRTFLAGVVLEDDGSTSADFVRLLLRMFALGSPGLPAAGMQALPQQIADDLAGRVHTGVEVEVVREAARGALVQAGGVSARADLVVVATGAGAAHRLLGVPVPPTKGVVTDWFSAPQVPDLPPLLVLEGRGPQAGPVRNAAVMDAAAPSYAPPGRHLVQASCLLENGVAPEVEVVRRHTGELYGTDVSDWELVLRHEVPDALPVQPPPLSTRRPQQVSPSVLVAGDHRDTASIQGALVSGERAAQGWLRRSRPGTRLRRG